MINNNVGKKFLHLSIAVAIFTTVVLVSALIYLKISVHGKFPPKTFVSGIDISGATFKEAADLLEKSGEKYASSKITILFEDKEYKVSVKELRPKLFIPQTLNTIKETDGRDFGVLDLFIPKEYEEKNSEIISSFNEEDALLKIDQAFKLTELEPKSANFLMGKDGQLEIIPEKSGKVVNKKELIEALKSRISNLSEEPVIIKAIAAEPLIFSATLEAQKLEIYEKLKHSVTLEDPIYSDDWVVKLKDHLDWVVFSTGENYCLPLISDPSTGCDEDTQEKVHIQVNPITFNQFIDEELSKWLDKPAQNVEIKDSTEDRVSIIGHGADGRKIQRESLRNALELAIDNKVSSLKIPVISLPPEINISDNLKAKGIKEKVATGHTSYYGSPTNRVYNIKVAAAKLDGVIIAPGETFSFNDTIGAVDGSTGYRKELVIKKEGTVPDYGGGVCQVSTTVYRSALFAGLPIEERNEHSYAVSYYSQILGHGLDATIYIGGPNLKFKNDTENHLVMQAYTDPDYELYIVLYGTNDGRSIEMDGPYISNHRKPPATIYEETLELAPGQTKETEHAHAGFSVLWYRYLTDKNGNLTTEEITTNYRAMPAKVMVGKAAEPTPSP